MQASILKAFAVVGLAVAGTGQERQTFAQRPETTAQGQAKPLLTLLAGDVSNVLQTHSIAFSRDGKRLAVNGQHGMLLVWDAGTGEADCQVMTAAGLTASAPALSPDGKHVAAGVRSAVAVWDDRGVLVRRFKGHPGGIFTVTFSPDGKFLAAAGGGLSVWDFATGQKVLTLGSKELLLYSVAYSQSGKQLVIAGKEGILRVVDALTGKELRAIASKDALESACFSPDGNRVAAAEFASDIGVWDMRTGKRLLRLAGSRCVGFSPDGKYLATVLPVTRGKDERLSDLAILEAGTGTQVLVIRGTESITGLAFSPDSRRLATVSETAQVDVWDVATPLVKKRSTPIVLAAGEREPIAPRRASVLPPPQIRVEKRKPLLTLGGQQDKNLDRRVQTNSIQFTRDGSRLVGSALDGRMHVWDALSGKELLALAGDPGAGLMPQVVWDAAVSPDGQHLASCHGDKTVRIWDAASGRSVLIIRGYTDPPLRLAYSPTGKQLAVGDKEGGVRLWNAETGKEERRLAGHAERVAAISYSADGKRLVSAGLDGAARVWDVGSGKEVLVQPFGGSVYASLFRPDGEQVASAVADARGNVFVSMWDSATGKESFRLPGCNCLAFSANGKRLATALQQELHIWDATTGRPLLAMAMDEGVTGLALGPDGKCVAAITDEYTVKVWDVSVAGENGAKK
jgi:WD40 repeat protein